MKQISWPRVIFMIVVAYALIALSLVLLMKNEASRIAPVTMPAQPSTTLVLPPVPVFTYHHRR